MRSRLCLVALLVASVVPASACSSVAPGESVGQTDQSWTVGVPPCGAAIGSWGSTTAYSNGACFGNVNCVNCDGQGFTTHVSSNGQTAYGGAWQCVELITRYFDRTYHIWLSNNAGSPLCNSARSTSGLTVYGPGYSSAAPEPVAGDALVWNYNGGFGHTALVTGASGSTINYLEQNWGSPTGYSGTGHTSWGGSNFGAPSDSLGGFSPVCWIHANANSALTCPQGNGLYCGGDGVGGTMGTLYQCSNGTLTPVTTCDLGCQNMPARTNDRCAPCPNGDGLYCGGHQIPGDTKTLYQCTGGSLTVSKVCTGTCQVEPGGTNDQCPPPPSDAGVEQPDGAPLADAGLPHDASHTTTDAGRGDAEAPSAEDAGGGSETYAAPPVGSPGGCTVGGVRRSPEDGRAGIILCGVLAGVLLSRRRRVADTAPRPR